MLELVAASAIISIAIVPALAVMRKRVLASMDLRHYEWMHCRCVAVLEQAMATTAACWEMNTTDGVLGSVDSTPFRYMTVASDRNSVGGVPGKLAVVDALVFRDSNRNRTRDAGEIEVRMATKVAKTLTYQEIANDR